MVKKMNKLKSTSVIFSQFITLIILTFLVSVLPPINAAQLKLTIHTDKSTYGLGDLASINGNLTVDGAPAENALVAIEIRDSSGLPFIFRTRPTSQPISGTWAVDFTQIYPCDSNGNPKNNFTYGERLYIFLTIKNFDTISHNVIVCITIIDQEMIPVGTRIPAQTSLEPKESKTFFFYFGNILETVSSGTATIYATLYSTFPKDGGIPYSPEKAINFTIIETKTTSTSSIESKQNSQGQNPGTYEIIFRLPPNEGRIGNYTAYARAYYQGSLAIDSIIFEVKLIGDINGDGFVNAKDAVLLGIAFGSQLGDPNWNEKADLNGDYWVNAKDAVILGWYFGNSALQ